MDFKVSTIAIIQMENERPSDDEVLTEEKGDCRMHYTCFQWHLRCEGLERIKTLILLIYLTE